MMREGDGEKMSLTPERDEVWARHDRLSRGLAAELLELAGRMERDRDRLRVCLVELVRAANGFAEEWLEDVEDSSIEERYFNNGDFRRLAEGCDRAVALLDETAPG